jgi:putative tryptophan/tyrosine transport system substrate-binding protein
MSIRGMKRRAFIAALGGAAAWPVVGRAQQPGKVWRIGYLAESHRPNDDVFREALRKLGYVEGRNLTIIYRWGESSNYGPLAEDLVRLNVDLIVAVASPATRAAKDATNTIPIVIVDVGDPVAYGFIASLARPGGNITGMSSQLLEIGPKGLRFIRELIPTAAKLAILRGGPSDPGTEPTLARIGEAARTQGFKAESYAILKSDDFTKTFTAIARERPDALFVNPNHFLYTERARIIDFVLTNRIPAIYGLKEYATDGGLMALGPNRDEMASHAAVLVDKILKGAKPADLPVEQPTNSNS